MQKIENINKFQTVGEFIAASEDFVKNLDKVFEHRKKEIIVANKNEIAEKNLLKEKLKSEIKELSFFDFKTKSAKKDELKALKTSISIIKKYKYANDLINAKKSKLDKIKNDYITSVDKFMLENTRTSLEKQYNDFLEINSQRNRKYDLSSHEKSKLINEDVKNILLKYLCVSGRKTCMELAQYFEPLIPNCTPQYIMAIIRPLIHNSGRDFQGIVVRIEEKDNVFFDIKTLNHLKQNPKWHEEEIRSYENNPFLKWHFLKDDLITENEQVPQIPKI